MVRLPLLLPPSPASTGRGFCAFIEVRRAVRLAMGSLAMMAADASEVPVLAMISARGCPYLRKRMSLPMVRRVLIVP